MKKENNFKVKVGAFNYPASLQISYFPEAYALNDILNIGIIS